MSAPRGAALGAEAQRPEQGAALVGPGAVDLVALLETGAVVDRGQEEGGVRGRHLREVGGLIAGGKLLHPSRDPLLRLWRYHQTVESIFSSSSTGRV